MSLGHGQVRKAFTFAPQDDQFHEGGRRFGEEPIYSEWGSSFPEMLVFVSRTLRADLTLVSFLVS